MHRGLDKLTICLLGLALVAYITVRPKFVLRPEIPAGFLDQVPGAQHATETRIATAYWECVVEKLQWTYRYGDHLPTTPPPEFTVAGHGLGPKAESPSARAHYWMKAQQAWYLPNNWDKHYVFDISWMKDPGRHIHQWIYEGTPAEQ